METETAKNNGGKTKFTKSQNDLMVCLNSPEFRTILTQTVFPQIKELGDKLHEASAAIENQAKQMHEQAEIIGQLREQLIACNQQLHAQNGQLNKQDQTINELKGSIAITKTTLNADKKDQLLQLKISGLEGEDEPSLKNKLVETAGSLDPAVELSADNIKLQIIKPKAKEGKTAPPHIHIFTINNIWKKRELYSARRQLFGTGVFISENLGPKQRALFFKCRQLKKEGKIQATWTNELVIFVKTNTGATLPITKEADLAPLTGPFPPQYMSPRGVSDDTPPIFTAPPLNSTPMPGHHQANMRTPGMAYQTPMPYQTPGPSGSVIHLLDSPPPPPPRRNIFPTPPPAASQVREFDLLDTSVNRR